MKTIKINMSENSISKPIKSITIGISMCILTVIGCTALIALFLNITGSFPEALSGYIMLLPLIAGGFIGGYVAARINKSSGLIMGVISTAVVLLAIIITGFVNGSDITYMLLLKAVTLLLSGAVGGVKGVNKKEKLKI